ncbi:double-strand break repair protein AddB [Dongia deserti]|uniref:double-strand break repair protein AddB n=1 Tax=Dongia deserti TaxID=2268030 RepID=UPI000E65505D|nr:double-strand break repair protein AddB [Dongia deserti]
MPSPLLRDTPRVFSIPSGVSFAETLAAELLRQVEGDPLKLSEMTVLLPNRRACRTLQEAFLRQAVRPDQSSASLLPRLMPIGDLDSDDLTVLGGALFGEAADIPPAIGELKRRMLLARLIMAAPARGGPRAGTIRLDQATQLAAELARLLDQVETERKDLSALEGLVPESLAAHWQLTINFLDILRRAWPDILAEEGAIDPAERRNRLLDLQRAVWEAAPPQMPIIAAGSTGSIPAAADLMHTIARLPQGAVYLPGLDRAPSDEDWQAIADDPSHPQYGLAQLLKRFEATRDQVADVAVPNPLSRSELPSPEAGEGDESRARILDAPRQARAEIVSAALLPAERTHGWKERAETLLPLAVGAAIAGVSRIDCPSEREEAQVVALALRRFIAEHEEGVAALVTPDRRLARRVAAELKRWRIEIDDSAGQPLSQTAPGAYLLALCDAAANEWAPIPLLALLKHPLAAGGRRLGSLRKSARRLDRDLLRGPRPAPGWQGLRQAIEARDEFSSLSDLDAEKLLKVIDSLERATAAMADWTKPMPPVERLRAVVASAEALAATSEEIGIQRLWRGEAGEALSDFVHDALQSFSGLPNVPAEDFTALMLELLSGIAVRPRFGRHPRLFIWGPLEARLQQADLLVLGSLNEGTWPAESAIDPWLNRPMRQGFGLPAPERKIGLSAHDFQQAMGAPKVLLTRAERVDGAPTVPSRWLLRLNAFLSCTGDGLPANAHALERRLAHMIDRPDKVETGRRPMPKPGAARRPNKLSVTQIEAWRRNPYAIYARHILRLEALDPLDQDPNAAELGTAVHAALHEFTRTFPHALPSDALALLRAEGEAAFRPWLDRPNVWAFWQPRFQRIAAWWLKQERERRTPQLTAIATELKGTLELADVAPSFTLAARADRIDTWRDGGLTIIDYKTGTLPKKEDIELGFAPQLTLEAAMALAGAFEGIGGTQIAELAHWKLSGSRDGGTVDRVKGNLMALAGAAIAGLIALVRDFSDDTAAYVATPDPQFAPRYDDYAHLARNIEWLSEREQWP